MLTTTLTWLLLATFAFCSNTLAPAGPPSRSICIIRGGTIVDGTGNPWFRGRRGHSRRPDRFGRSGRLRAPPARKVIDARGLVVAPGFIDMHSHSDMTLLEDGSAPSKVRQGVTTEILGEDTSAGPAKGKRSARTFKGAGANLHLVDTRRLLRGARTQGNRRQRGQLRRPGHAARMRAGRFARPTRPQARSRRCRC